MVKIAHASSREKAVLQMKKLRKGKTKKKLEENKLKEEMTEEEYKEFREKRATKTYSSIAANIIWDYKHHQLSISKRAWVIDMLEHRLIEIEEDTIPHDEEKKDIQVILDGFRS